jgi:hypothetical protein
LGRFWAEKAAFGQKKGQNQGFSVTDSLTLPKCKALIVCMLREIGGSKQDFHKVGGGGTRKTGTRNQGLRNRKHRGSGHCSSFDFAPEEGYYAQNPEVVAMKIFSSKREKKR